MKKKIIFNALILAFLSGSVCSADPQKPVEPEVSTAKQSIFAKIVERDKKDIDNSWANSAVKEMLYKYGILAGYPDGTFQGNKAASRFELAQGLLKLIEEVEQQNVKIEAVDRAALETLRENFSKEITRLSGKVEYNEQQISGLQQKHDGDVAGIETELKKLEKRHHFVPELRFRYGFGSADDSADTDGSLASTRLRLNSKTKVSDKTDAILRLQAAANNMINHSETNGDVVDLDLTLAYVGTDELTYWIPKKLGELTFYGGLMPANRLFTTSSYTVCVDQRGFTDANYGLSEYNSMFNAFGRENTDGRRMAIGGEYFRPFNKYNAYIKGFVLRSTGGSINIPGADIPGSGKEATFYAVTGQMDLPVKSQPVQLKVTHLYSFNDNGTNLNTYSVGGRLSTKFNNVGVLKLAVIGYGGGVPPRLIEGTGGRGMSYQVAFNPTSKAFGNFFGDPDKISYQLPDYTPGKTEVGFAVSNLRNDYNERIRAFDLFFSRYLSKNTFGRILFSHLDPTSNRAGVTTKDLIMLETIFKVD